MTPVRLRGAGPAIPVPVRRRAVRLSSCSAASRSSGPLLGGTTARRPVPRPRGERACPVGAPRGTAGRVGLRLGRRPRRRAAGGSSRPTRRERPWRGARGAEGHGGPHASPRSGRPGRRRHRPRSRATSSVGPRTRVTGALSAANSGAVDRSAVLARPLVREGRTADRRFVVEGPVDAGRPVDPWLVGQGLAGVRAVEVGALRAGVAPGRSGGRGVAGPVGLEPVVRDPSRSSSDGRGSTRGERTRWSGNRWSACPFGRPIGARCECRDRWRPGTAPVGRVAQRTASSSRSARRASAASAAGRPGRGVVWPRSGVERSRSAWAIRSATRRCGGRAGGRPAGGGTGPARRSARPRSRRAVSALPESAPRSIPARLRGRARVGGRLGAVLATAGDLVAECAGDASGDAVRHGGHGVHAVGQRVAATAVMVVGASTNGAGRAGARGPVRPASAARAPARAPRAAAAGREPSAAAPSAPGTGTRPRTDHGPRSIVRRAASSSAAALVGPVATPYSIQRGPSTPTNSDEASPVRACSSRPHSPVNDRTVAPPSRSDSSISAARSGHSRSVRGAASALTESRPAGSMTCTACSRPSSGSTDTTPPSGHRHPHGTEVDPIRRDRRVADVVFVEGTVRGRAVADVVTRRRRDPDPAQPTASSARAPMVRAPGSSPGSTGSATDPLTAVPAARHRLRPRGRATSPSRHHEHPPGSRPCPPVEP